MARDNLESLTDKEDKGVSNFKKKRASKLLAYGLALALFASPFLSKKLSAEMLYNEVHPVQMYRAASPRYKKIDTTDVRVRIDATKKDNKRYDIYFSIFTKGYNIGMPEIGCYDFINGTYSKLCIAYSDNLSINPYKIKQRSNQVFKRDYDDKDMYCEWSVLTGQGPEMPIPKFVKEIEQVYDVLNFFFKSKDEGIQALAEDYHFMDVPFGTVDHHESAKIVVIPVEVEGKGDSKIKFLSNIVLQRVGKEDEETGSKKICIDINLK